ncbi:hypothetical protein QFZ63_001732 [Streptomyces sp. B3I7]|uniref:hypothetical protein n=1 Tax=Streptomyces sp. B3I7 TaxID=3042269 RepID=UPI00278880B7|nr:hypothetical protein [Streptomyces sp. B3I7]MDQ0810018.1 hypothetical protein [Streptomyces sp. B3I7]
MAGAGLTAVLALMTSACGPADSDAPGSADKAAATTKAVRSALARVADRTEAARSARVEETIEGGADEPLSMRGAFTWNDDYAFDVETEAAGAGLEDVAVGSTIRVRRVGHTCYYALGQETTGRFAGKKWLKVGSSCGDSVVDVLDAFTGGSPSALLKSLPYAHEVQKLGKETVNGQSATHYRTVMNQKDIAKFEDDHEEEGALLRTAAAGAKSVPLDLWINADDLPVRTKQSTGPGPVTVTLDFEKFGTTEAIGTPPAEQTGDFTEEMRKASGM